MPSEERAFAPVAQAKFSICLTRRSETEIRRLRQNVYLCNFPVFAKRRFASNPLSSGSSGKCSFAIAKKLQNLTQIISDGRTPLTSRFSAADADRYTSDGHPFLMRFGFFCASCRAFFKSAFLSASKPRTTPPDARAGCERMSGTRAANAANVANVSSVRNAGNVKESHTAKGPPRRAPAARTASPQAAALGARAR